MTLPWLKTFDQIEGGDLPLVGAKSYNLATLFRNGLPVPNGLVVTTAFFEAQLKHHQLIPLWAGSPDVAVTEGALYWLADALKVSPLAGELMAALRARLVEVFPDVEHFAVRSSAIDEDTRDHAFSGIHLSELGVPRDLIPVSISRCWASALSKPALQYRQKHGLPIQSIRPAVLIQPFVKSRVAGVAFTVNPLTGARDELVVEAAFGSGSAVVSGRVAPTRYYLEKNSPDYPLIMQSQADGPNASVARQDVAVGDNHHSPLSPSQRRTLAQYLEQIEALLAAPQDVEWVVANERSGEEFLFLQTRPITALPSADVSVDVEWSRANHREFLPDLPSPLCVSLMERTQNRVPYFLTRLGFDVKDSGAYLRVIYGRPYLNLTLARRLLAQGGLNPSGLLWVIGHTELPGERVGTHAIDGRQAWRTRGPLVRLLLQALRARMWLKRFERLGDDIRRSLLATDWEDASSADLLHRFRLRIQLSNHMTEVNVVLTAASVVVAGIACWALAPVVDAVGQFVNDVHWRGLDTSRARQGRALLQLAKLARAGKEASRYLTRYRDDYEEYRQVLAGTQFLAEFDRFLEQYGWNATFEADLGWPRYSESPPALLETIAHMASSDVDLTSADNDTHSNKGLEFNRGWRGWLGGWAIGWLRNLTLMRDELRRLYGRSMTDCRTWDLNLARRWQTRGWLSEPEDYFWLTMKEIERALMAEAEMGPTLPAVVRGRRETYQTYASTDMPYALRESDVARLIPGEGLQEVGLSSVMSGLPVSPGQVQGHVIVLCQPEDSTRMVEGAILVTPSTDPAWFSVFPQARGLIVETGGLLSHGSIIAREFGLPAVANIPDATRRFCDGDLVLLDGSTGVVQVLQSAADCE